MIRSLVQQTLGHLASRGKHSAAAAPISRRLSFEQLEDRRMMVSEQTVWTPVYTALDAQFNANVKNSSFSSDSGILAWDESYVLSSYLTMYQATGSTSYLNEFVTQANRILKDATNVLHNNGYLGWATFDYSVNMLANGTFASAASNDQTLPAGWTRLHSTASTAFLNPALTDAGAAVVTIKTSPSHGQQILETPTWNGLVSQNKPYEPNTVYRLTFDATTNGLAGGEAVLYDATTKTIVAQKVFSAASWQSYSFTFTAPRAAGHNLILELSNYQSNVANGSVSFAKITMQQQAEYLVQDGMITAPMAEFVAEVKTTPALLHLYGATAQTYDTFIRTNVLAKWQTDFRQISPTSGVYVAPNDGSLPIPGNSLPTNQNLALGLTYLWLWVADQNPVDRQRVIQLGDAFASTLKLVDNGQAYSWDYADPILPTDYYATGSEDTSHGNIDVLFATEAYQHGLVFNATDMTRFANTFTMVMWNQSAMAPVVSQSVNGSGTTSSTLIIYGWAGLMPYSRLNSLAWVITDSVYNHNRGALGPLGWMLETIAQIVEL